MPVSVPVSVDVTVSEVLAGVVEIEGVLSYSDQTVAFAYQTKNALARQSEVETFQVRLDQLRDAELKRQPLGATIRLYPRRASSFEYVPGVSRHEMTFKVKHRHRAEAARLVADLQRGLAERGGDVATRIPFRLPDANLGFTEITGLLYLEETFLVFEVQSGLSGGSRKKQHVIKIEPEALEAIRLDPGPFRDQLSVRPKKRDLFRAMPGMYKDKTELTMTLRKKYRAEAERLVDEVRRRQKG